MVGRRLPGESLSDYIKSKTGKLFRKNQTQEIRYRTQVLRDLYNEVVRKSSSYLEFISWADKLGLLRKELESRPTIREIYLFKGAGTARDIEKIKDMRKDIRYDALRHPDLSVPAYARAFPEERKSSYLKELGLLLGYPECCIERYVFDRNSGVITPESRAANQIIHAEDPDEVISYAYFTKDFFPCQPDCENAVEIGRRIWSALNEISKEVAGEYKKHLYENVALVKQYPEIIQRTINSLEKVSGVKKEGKSSDRILP